jgi:hypothetical protein
VILARYRHRKSTMITSNRPIEDWGKLLGDNAAASVILDRLMHHGHLLKFEGKSYRLKEASKRLALEKKKTELPPVLPTLGWGIFKWPSGIRSTLFESFFGNILFDAIRFSFNN